MEKTSDNFIPVSEAIIWNTARELPDSAGPKKSGGSRSFFRLNGSAFCWWIIKKVTPVICRFFFFFPCTQGKKKGETRQQIKNFFSTEGRKKLPWWGWSRLRMGGFFVGTPTKNKGRVTFPMGWGWVEGSFEFYLKALGYGFLDD